MASQQAHGERDGYRWFEWPEGDVTRMFEACPGAVLGQLAVIVTWDSGPFGMGDAERASSWHLRGDLSVTPVVHDLSVLPHFDLYDEVWTFEEGQALPTAVEPSINNTVFTLRDPDTLVQSLDPTWDHEGAQAHLEVIARCQQNFWRQVAAWQPRSCVYSGDRFGVVTRDPAVAACLDQWAGPDLR